MKKSLRILLISWILLLSNSKELYIKFDQPRNENILLNIPLIRQEKEYYCVAASIQTIFSYFQIDIKNYSQEKIYNELLQQNPNNKSFGSQLSQVVANYIVLHIINNRINSAVLYDYNLLGSNFGSSIEEIKLFQSFIYETLLHNQPVLFGYRILGNNVGHLVLIIGIEFCFENPWLTQYKYFDPFDGKICSFFASTIKFYTSSGGAVIGYGSFSNEDKLKKAVLG